MTGRAGPPSIPPADLQTPHPMAGSHEIHIDVVVANNIVGIKVKLVAAVAVADRLQPDLIIGQLGNGDDLFLDRGRPPFRFALARARVCRSLLPSRSCSLPAQARACRSLS